MSRAAASGWRPDANRRKKKRTSIGHSKNSRSTHKNAKRRSKYRGQGK